MEVLWKFSLYRETGANGRLYGVFEDFLLTFELI